MSDPIEDLKRLGIRLEADKGQTIYHRRILTMAPILNTRTGNICTLECGHIVQTFGKVDPVGKVLCTECRDAKRVKP